MYMHLPFTRYYSHLYDCHGLLQKLQSSTFRIRFCGLELDGKLSSWPRIIWSFKSFQWHKKALRTPGHSKSHSEPAPSPRSRTWKERSMIATIVNSKCAPKQLHLNWWQGPVEGCLQSQLIWQFFCIPLVWHIHTIPRHTFHDQTPKLKLHHTMLTLRQFFSSSLFGTALPLVAPVLHSETMAKTCSHCVGRDASMDLVSGSNLSSYLGSHGSDFWASGHRMPSPNPHLQTAALQQTFRFKLLQSNNVPKDQCGRTILSALLSKFLPVYPQKHTLLWVRKNLFEMPVR